ncbi:hypothetical protein [Paenibacillus odorifer]|uniref:hypothetical protein n=2 Tax=Paenibacillus TaxID=44249 RepID=UPI00096E28C5|nr:hypothetical protein [Paenibacillus odorifer]OMD81180.1 hypothetical protein BSK53_19375 [Paenibacillus odorifer]
MYFVRENEDKVEIYCQECGKIHLIPSNHCKGQRIDTYVYCSCGSVGDFLVGRKANDKGKSYLILSGGVIISILIFSQSRFWGWTTLIVTLIIFLSSLVDESKIPKVKQMQLFDSFYRHRAKLVNSNQYYISSSNEAGIIVDDENNAICIMYNDLQNSNVYNANDIIEIELIEDGNSIIKTSRGNQLGGALVGAAVAGGVGAIIGGLSGKGVQQDTVTQLSLKIIVNNIKNPVVIINFLSIGKNKEGIKKTSEKYKRSNKLATHWHGVLSVMIRRADEAE